MIDFSFAGSNSIFHSPSAINGRRKITYLYLEGQKRTVSGFLVNRTVTTRYSEISSCRLMRDVLERS